MVCLDKLMIALIGTIMKFRCTILAAAVVVACVAIVIAGTFIHNAIQWKWFFDGFHCIWSSYKFQAFYQWLK